MPKLIATFEIPYYELAEGYDPEQVQAIAGQVIQEVRSQQRPAFLKIQTARYREHVGPGEDFNAGYRSEQAMTHWKARDPLLQQSPELDAVRHEIQAEIDNAIQFAMNSPLPTSAELLTDVILILIEKETLVAAMREAMDNHEHTMIIGQGVADFKGLFGTTSGLDERYPTRVIETPLAEDSIAGICIGAALNGMYPINTHIRADFGLLIFNQLINLAAKYRYMFGGLFVR